MVDWVNGKMAKMLKEEDIKSIAEVVRTPLQEELDVSLQQVANKAGIYHLKNFFS